jgi:hypothetical protein
MTTYTNNIIKDALEEYDKHAKLYKLFETSSAVVDPPTDNKRAIITIKLEDGHILKSEIELIGVFYIPTNIWRWSWAIPTVGPFSHISTQLLNYGIKLHNSPGTRQLRYLITTSNGIIENKIILDIMIALSSYLAKVPYVFCLENEQAKSQYWLFLSNTKEISEYENIITK